jgi:hypothetical protein
MADLLAPQPMEKFVRGIVGSMTEVIHGRLLVVAIMICVMETGIVNKSTSGARFQTTMGLPISPCNYPMVSE